MPVVTYRVDKTDGSAWDIVNDPEFDGDNGAGLDLYLAWTTDDIYNGDENGNLVNRGQSLRMRLADLQAGSIQNADGSYTVTYNTALPTDYSGDIMLSLGGRPATLAADADGIEAYQRSAATAAVFYPDSVRQYQADSDGCNACHQQLQFHGTNRSGDTEMCLVCHDADFVGGNGSVAMSAMIHRIHTSPEITYPLTWRALRRGRCRQTQARTAPFGPTISRQRRRRRPAGPATAAMRPRGTSSPTAGRSTPSRVRTSSEVARDCR
jgi:OmcA/MtrC family decaheme c-type cytochrome